MKYEGTVFKMLGWLFAIALLQACSVNRFIPEDSYLLDRVSIKSDSLNVSPSVFQGYVRQHPNRKWLSSFKVPLGIYCLSGKDSTKRINRFVRRLGEAPVIYNQGLSYKTQKNIEAAVRNMGYLNADVELTEQRYKDNKVRIKYQIHPKNRYTVRNLRYEMQDSAIGEKLMDSSYVSLLSEGMPFDVNMLEMERSRINSKMLNDGYYKFNKDFIRFEADTTVGNHQVDLKLILRDFTTGQSLAHTPHQQYRIGDVNYIFDQPVSKNPFVKQKVVSSSTDIVKGDLYTEKAVHSTYSRLSRLGALLSTNIRFLEDPLDSTLLNANITVAPNKANSFNVELEGTNSAGDFGAALSTSYQNRNLLRGSELFSIKLRGAFEAIKGLKGYNDEDYIEYSAEVGLKFPNFKFPFLSQNFKHRALATSELSLMFDSQDRPEFHRRVLTGAWRYRWTGLDRRFQNKFDLLNLNYVFMPWISETFRSHYLDDPENRNAILRYNYENLFIMSWGYTFTYNSLLQNANSSNYGTNAYTVRAGVETSGNLLYGLSHLLGANPNDQNQYTLFNIAYAEYVKADVDFSKSFRVDEFNSLALHFGLGVAFPYGNSSILPYEKRYFSGGANSVRGWSVRGLGPGSFMGHDGRIDFINQTGDIKLDMNFEYRSHLVWKLDFAAFVDAGNIWTIRNYADQPGGQFRLDKFWKQIAVSYGVGFRLNFDYFILRLDGGMKAIHPAYTDARHHYPVIYPNFRRDFSLHFAVGLPF